MTSTKKRPYLYEVDLMRVIFIGGVLLNHTTTAFTQRLAATSNSHLFLEMTHLMLHFTRMGFMFMTGLVLVLNYYHRDQHWLYFWQKRYISVGIPYVGWNAIIMLVATLGAGGIINWPAYWSHLGNAIQYGNRYYMYYILVTFQLYLIFPLLIALFKCFPDGHKVIMGVSIALQFFLLIYLKYWLPSVDRTQWWYLFRYYGNNVLVYQVYFLAGAFVAIHYHEVDNWIKAHAKLIGRFTGLLALGTIALYFGDQKILHLSMAATHSVHQPYIMVYDLFMIAFVFWIGRRYAYAREHGLPAGLDRGIRSLAKVSFGLYLVQSLPLFVLDAVLPLIHLPAWLLLILLPVGYAWVLGGSFAISWFCYRVPPFGALIGRPQWHPLKGVYAYVQNHTKPHAAIAANDKSENH